MPSWALPLFVFLVWCLWAVAAATQRAAEDARRGIPVGHRGGVSVLPVIPLFPLAFWACAWLIDRAAGPWGTVFVGASHLAFAVGLTVSILRDSRRLRSHDSPA